MKKLLFKLGRFLVNRYIVDFADIATPRMAGCKCHIEKRACLMHSPRDFTYPENLTDEIDRDYFKQWIEYVRQIPPIEFPDSKEYIFVDYNGQFLFSMDQNHASPEHIHEFMRDLTNSGKFEAFGWSRHYQIKKKEAA